LRSRLLLATAVHEDYRVLTLALESADSVGKLGVANESAHSIHPRLRCCDVISGNGFVTLATGSLFLTFAIRLLVAATVGVLDRLQMNS
jgi:hypothetical protein